MATETAIFLKLGDIKGQSKDKDHKDWINISTYGYGITMNIGAGAGQVRQAGRASFGDIQITKLMDKASPSIAEAAASGQHFKTAEIESMSAAGGDKRSKLIKITLENVHITTLQHDGQDNEVAKEKIGLSYGKIKWEVTTTKPDGSEDAPVRAGWDRDENKKWA